MSRSHGKCMVFIFVISLMLVGAVWASDWRGENGVVRFSFVEGDKLVDVFDAGEPVNGMTTVDVTAWLTDVDQVTKDGERFMRMGGFELDLVIEGAKAMIISQEFPSEVLSVGPQIGSVIVGLTPGEKFFRGKAKLVTWRVMFEGRPQNVRFGLAVNGTFSCRPHDDCMDALPPMVYIGVESSNQLGDMFGGGYVPGWLNASGEPDRTAVHSSQSYEDVGLFTKR